MIDKQEIRQILDDNSNDSGYNCWEFTKSEIDTVVDEISNYFEKFVNAKLDNNLEMKIEGIKKYIIERRKYYQDKQDASHFWNVIEELKAIEKQLGE